MALLMNHPQAASSMPHSGLSSPTGSVFVDDDVRQWDEARVSDWLHSVNCAKYAHLFAENHINGETLLEVDQNIVRELGVTKIGDRVRISVAIKALRARALSKKSKTSLASLDSASVSPFPAPAASSAVPPISPTHVSNPPPTTQQRTATLPLAHPSRPLEQNFVKFIFTKGLTKVVDISGCFNGEAIIKKGIRKFGSKDQPTDWTIYVTDDVGNIREVQDVELVSICHTTVRPERERLVLVRIGQTPSSEEYQKSLQIAREQLAREVTQRPGTFIDSTTASEQQWLQQRQQQLISAQAKPNVQVQTSSMSSTEDGVSPNGSPVRTKRMRNFFGQRPPSELISSNLAEYFPGHESRVLEQTVRNSIRRSKRISSMSRRMSVATTASYASSTTNRENNRESMPPVPTVGDAWLSANSGTTSSNRKSQVQTTGSIAPSPPALARSGSNLRRVQHRSSVSVSSSVILTDEDQQSTDTRRTSPPLFEAGEESDEFRDFQRNAAAQSMRQSPAMTGRPFSVFSRAETIASIMSDNNSYIEVDNVDDIPEEASDAEFDGAEDVDGGPTRWIRGALIGAGSFGSVVLGLNALTGELMAVKQVELTQNNRQGDQARKKSMIDALQREIQLLRDLQHENIVQYLGSNSDGQFLNIFLEYVPGGSVATLLNNYGPLEEPLIRIFVKQILCGLNYLHGRDIVHRDIKGANVLVDNKGKIKISDFGISKRVEAGLLASGNNQPHRPSLQGSVYWMAPEVVKQTSYTRKADIWSLGCLVVEMFTGTHPFPEFSQMQALFRIGTQACTPEIPKIATPIAREFLNLTFELDHEKRPIASELLDHAFLEPIVAVGAGNSVSNFSSAEATPAPLPEGVAAALMK
ncbi:kinase-like domain-containing protein [Myxozyma melibiosi]|uniref:mitogen-activated protein kinase kinase kinase n=1 Tax=Myxozyma melibiosi TaxID=54550 RepID=A0ABR1FBZ4_9ASCO